MKFSGCGAVGSAATSNTRDHSLGTNIGRYSKQAEMEAKLIKLLYLLNLIEKHHFSNITGIRTHNVRIKWQSNIQSMQLLTLTFSKFKYAF